MKLFTRYSRINTAITVGIFLLGAVVFYFVVQYVLIEQLDETLLAEQEEIEAYVRQHHALPEIENTHKQWITTSPDEQNTGAVTRRNFRTVTRFSRRAHENERIRQLTFHVVVGETQYAVTVNKSEVEAEDLLRIIVPIALILVGLVLGAGLVVNRTLVRYLLKPFYATLDRIREYRISEKRPLALQKQSTDELSLLNDTLNEMTARIHKDYTALQEFTGNAAHEMQTPLSVIRSKIERMVQDPQLREGALKQLQGIDEAATRLAQLHQSLLLLTRLENRQFHGNEPVDIGSIVATRLGDRKEWLAARKIEIEESIVPLIVSFHKQLAEIMVSNLLSNAYHYTPEGGRITVSVERGSLTLSNTATSGALDAGRVFQRFYRAPHKGYGAHEGIGLGLAITKEIALLGEYHLEYRFHEGKHAFTVTFVPTQAG